MVEEILQLHGYRVISVSDGQEAYELFRERSGEVDLILTDVAMPRMNGTTLARKCRQAFPDTAILFMSGYVDDRLDRNVDLKGRTDFIAKPFRH